MRGSRYPVIVPKVAAPNVVAIVAGLVWFKTLVASARNWMLRLSYSLRFLNSEASNRQNPGPFTDPRGVFPKVCVPRGTFWKAAVLNHCVVVCGAPAFGSPI